MTAVDVFTYADREVRTIAIDSEPWFVASDVCAVLGISNHRDAVATLDDDERGVGSTDTLGGTQNVVIVSEPGLYALIGRSRKAEAKAFGRWVRHDVLPAIRKTGSYGMPSGIDFSQVNPDLLISQALIAAQAKIEAIEARAAALEAPAAAWNDLAAADGDVTISDAAKVLGRAGISTGPRKLYDWLEANRWIYKRTGAWHTMQTAQNAGYLVERIQDYRHPSGERRIGDPQIRVTPKGLERLRGLLTDEQSVARLATCPPEDVFDLSDRTINEALSAHVAARIVSGIVTYNPETGALFDTEIQGPVPDEFRQEAAAAYERMLLAGLAERKAVA